MTVEDVGCFADLEIDDPEMGATGGPGEPDETKQDRDELIVEELSDYSDSNGDYEKDDGDQLRTQFDSNDPFLTGKRAGTSGGHNIIKPRGGLRKIAPGLTLYNSGKKSGKSTGVFGRYERKIPKCDEWVVNDKEVEHFLNRVFPQASGHNAINNICVCRGRRNCALCVAKNICHRRQRWLTVIRVYFRMLKSSTWTAEELQSLRCPVCEEKIGLKVSKTGVKTLIRRIKDAKNSEKPKMKGHRPKGVKESKPRRRKRRNKFLWLERSVRQSSQ